MRFLAATLAFALVGLASCARSDGGPATVQAGIRNLELAADSLFLSADHAAFIVRETQQGNQDLNQDGDTQDAVLFVHDLASGVTTSTGVASPWVVLGGPRAVFPVVERDQGARDLNGDGDVNDFVLHSFDAATGVLDNLSVSPTIFSRSEHYIANTKAENGFDANGDGDEDDVALEVIDLRDGSKRVLPFALVHYQLVNEKVLLYVPEAGQGNQDLNGDGDRSDFVVHVHDLEADVTTNLLLSSFGQTASFDGELGAMAIRERDADLDLNGDGDQRDVVAHVFDDVRATNLGRPADWAQVHENFVVMLQPEDAEEEDLNGDGDEFDGVLVVHDLATGADFETGLAVSDLGLKIQAGVVVFGVPEVEQGRMDLNGDGDSADTVIHVLELATSVVTSTGVAWGSPTVDLEDGWVVFERSEAAESRDLNADGDALDRVLTVYDVEEREATNLALAMTGVGAVVDAGFVYGVVSEAAQGDRDLNDDGDRDDQVLFHLDLEEGLLVNTGMSLSYFWVGGTGNRSQVFLADEASQGGTDLNGDGDATDFVLHVLRP